MQTPNMDSCHAGVGSLLKKTLRRLKKTSNEVCALTIVLGPCFNWSKLKNVTIYKLFLINFGRTTFFIHITVIQSDSKELVEQTYLIGDIYWLTAWSVTSKLNILGNRAGETIHFLNSVSYNPNYKTAISDKITCWEGGQFPLIMILHPRDNYPYWEFAYY